MRRIAIASLLLLLVAVGCKLTPDYERPALEEPESWIRTADSRDSIANLEWWKVYEDEALTNLIRVALERNRDLALALARMEEARYLVTFTRAEQFPFLDVFGGAGRGRNSKEIVPGAKTENTFQLGGNLSFEVDLWRKYARGTEAARADLLASEWAYRSVTISLVADVATTYLLLQDYDSRLAISERTARGRQDRLDIISARFEKGTVPQLDVNQAEVQLAIADASVAQFQRLVAQTEHALRVLLGQYPGPIERGQPIVVGDWPLQVPAGLPSELLKRRPDVVEAEQRLAAETARIGVAQAMRFPALSLTAQASVIAEDLTDLNSTDAGQWNVMAGIFQPIFNSGRLKAQYQAQRARTEQTLHAYIGTLQNAFREVEDSLVGIETFRRELSARNRQVTAAGNALRLSQARYDGGVVDYLEVLNSEQNLFDAELQESIASRSTLTSFVTLYKALGGGWSDDRVEEGEEQEETPDEDEGAQGDMATDEDAETPS